MTREQIAQVVRIVKEQTLVPIRHREMIVDALRAALATESAPPGEVRLVERSEDGKRGYAQGYTAGVTASISACLMEPPERQSTIGTLVLERASDRIAALLSALPAPSPTPVAADDALGRGEGCQECKGTTRCQRPGCDHPCNGCNGTGQAPSSLSGSGEGR